MINDDGRNKLEGEKGNKIWNSKGKQVRLSPGCSLWQCKVMAVLCCGGPTIDLGA